MQAPRKRESGLREAAFFDLDKTVIARSSVLAFSLPLHREGLLDTPTALKAAFGQLLYVLQGADRKKVERLRDVMGRISRGWEKEKVVAVLRQELPDIVDPLIYEEALELMEEHRRAGRALYIVSASPEELVRLLADYIGVPHVIATRPEVVDGKYTGEISFYCFGEAKADAIREEAVRVGIDLSRSYAYSDSITDLPMLEAVGNPVAVNPDRQLARVAEERGWPVLTFRKQVRLKERLARLPRPSPLIAAAGAAVAVGAAAGMVAVLRSRRRTA
jgi:HAD superfamily hydrolase (TIGR01490 family)